MTNRFLDALSGTRTDTPPLWLMRQAGRYLPEYRQVRASEPDFISFCLNPEKAVEVTLQPIDKFGFDAAIIFSDILLVPWAMNRNVRFVPGQGPVLDQLAAVTDIDERDLGQIDTKLAPVGEALSLCRSQLAKNKALIGFAGAPWTIITYMLEGQSSRDFANARKWMWDNDRQFDALLEIVTAATIEFLALQARAGADALMLFDSWASAVPAEFRHRIVIDPARHIIETLRKRGIDQPIIGFPKGIGEGLMAYCDQTPVDGVGLDHGTDILWAANNLPRHITLQGNLDPLSLIAGGPAMYQAVDRIMDACAARAHIFNLGHGITPETPEPHVHDLVARVRGQKR
jgi:uroporphyrinogen decarboxylase